MQCPKCNGRLFSDQRNEVSCLNCGWIPVEPLPANIDLSMQTPRHSASKARQPQPWEFTNAGEYAVDARGGQGQ